MTMIKRYKELTANSAVQAITDKIRLRSEKRTDQEKELARDREEIYKNLAETIAKDVPVAELDNLIVWLNSYKESFEQEVTFHEEFDTFPQDGAVAFYKALQDTFGFVTHEHGGMGFFGPRPPTFLTVQVGPGKTVQMPWGGFSLPGYEGLSLVVGTHPSKDGFHFCISGSVKKKDKAVVDGIFEKTRENLAKFSIYKGKAISLKFEEGFDPASFSPADVAPEFLDLSNIDQDELVLPDAIMRQIQDNLFTPIEKTDLCRKFGVSLRRGVLLSGTYGIGKTLTAHVQALKATQHGWTFIYLKNVRNLADGLRVARQYAPAIVFAEDIDGIMEGEDRDEEMNEILNTVDGIELKGKEVMVVLTTNYVEDITPAMLRPGRIDALIELTPPDSKTAVKLLKVYGKGLINEGGDFAKVGEILNGQRPAMIAETVKRSKLSAITRMNSDDSELKVEPADLEVAAAEMKHHSELVDGSPKEELSEIEKVGLAQVTAMELAQKVSKSTEVLAG